MRFWIMRSSRPLAVLSAIAIFATAAGTAIGQQTDNSAPVAGRTTLGTTQMDVIAEGWRASKLIGASVYNDSNQKVGKIGDLIIAPDGSISVAILDVGGFLGLGPGGPPPLPSARRQRFREELVRALQKWPVSLPRLWEETLRFHYIRGLHRGWRDSQEEILREAG